jgi:hypothetical protein
LAEATAVLHRSAGFGFRQQLLNPVHAGTLLINARFISDHQADVVILFGIDKTIKLLTIKIS